MLRDSSAEAIEKFLITPSDIIVFLYVAVPFVTEMSAPRKSEFEKFVPAIFEAKKLVFCKFNPDKFQPPMLL